VKLKLKNCADCVAANHTPGLFDARVSARDWRSAHKPACPARDPGNGPRIDVYCYLSAFATQVIVFAREIF
jgi:hypothetical protein